MSSQSIYDAFLAHEGIALFEFQDGGGFKPLAELPSWCGSLWQAEKGTLVRIGDKSPFLENFLAEAEEFFVSRATGSANSGNWIETDSSGRQIPLEASAFWLAGKRVLLVRNISGTFGDQQKLFQTARDSLLAHERLMGEIQKKEILLHCIIHDLSQPLTSMRGCFDLLAGKKLAPDAAKFVQTGRRESQRQERMIRGILEAFSGDLAGEQTSGQTVPSSCDLISCAQRAVEQFAPAYTERGVRLVLAPYLDSERGWRVVGDAARVDRVFGNLLENALRYSPNGSTVTVGVEESGKALTAFVDDEGPGLPKGSSAKDLFALFSKGKDRPGKAGLGLYFCRMTTERWGGSSGAENRPKGGSRFWFRLPRAAEESGGSEDRASAAHANAQVAMSMDAGVLKTANKALRILVAEDNESVRELAVELLRARGHSVTGVGNGRAAIAAFDRLRPDVVLLDQEMPEMDGLEAARAIRRRENAAGGKRSLVVGLSGNATAEDERRVREAGMDALLSKPFERSSLFELIERQREASPPERQASPDGSPHERDLGAHLKKVTGGDDKLARKLAAGFLRDLPAKLSAIEQAISRKDADELASAAHALRGAFAIFDAQKSVVAARNLEAMGRSSRLQNATAEFRDLADDLNRLERELRELYPDTPPHKKFSAKPRAGAQPGRQR